MAYVIHLITLISLYTILSQSLNLTFGTARTFNLAHVGVYSIGAYATALYSTAYDGNLLVCVVLSMGAAAVFSLFLGLISLRLTSDYFAIGTLAFAFVVNALLINWKSVTNGVLGIPGIPRPELLGYQFSDEVSFCVLMVVLALFVQIVMWAIFRSPYARALQGGAENPVAAKTLGLRVKRYESVAFIIGSSFAGLAGAMFAFFINYIDPSSFMLTEIVLLLTIVVVGKPGSFWGCIIACAVLLLIPEGLRFLDLPSSILGPMRQLINAVILFSIVVIMRKSLFPVVRSV